MSDAAQTPRRSSIWLILSLCLNFCLIGAMVAGLIVARNRMIAGAVQGGEGTLPPEVMLRMLPPSGSAKMCDVISANTEAFRRLGRELVDARRDVFRAFRGDPFDAAAFKSALDRSTAAQVALVRLRQSIGLQVTEKLDAAERAELSRKLVQRFLAGGPRDAGDRRTVRELCAAADASGAGQPSH